MPQKLIEALATTIDLRAFMVRLLLAAFLGFMAAGIYGLMHKSRGSELRFLRLIPIITILMAVVASILTSSLAIAIGMVGAMSVIRFRSIIQDNGYQVLLLVAIAMGLVAGLGQAFLGVIFLVALAFVFRWMRSKTEAIAFRIQLEGKLGDLGGMLEKLQGQFPNLRVLTCAIVEEKGQWMLEHPHLPTSDFLQFRAFLVLHAPNAHIKIEHGPQT